MDKPLSNLDYLINRDNPQPQQQQREQQGSSRGVFSPPSVDASIDESVISLAIPVLQSLRKRNDRCSVFELVDDLNVSVNLLRPVLETFSQRFGWIDMQHVDLKGDDPVVLTDKGRTYLDKNSPR